MSRPLHTLAIGRYFEAPRWRDGRLWMVDSLARTVVTIDVDGHCETVCTVPDVPAGLGFLPTGEVPAGLRVTVAIAYASPTLYHVL